MARAPTDAAGKTDGMLLPPVDAGTADAAKDVPLDRPSDASTPPMDAPVVADAGLVDAFAGCRVHIVPESPSTSLTGLAPGRLTVRGVINWGSTTPVPPVWQWTVRDLYDAKLITIDGPPTLYVGASVVSFVLPRASNYYDISVSISPTCSGEVQAWTAPATQASQSFYLRALPPAASLANETCVLDESARWCPSQDAVHGVLVSQVQAGEPKTENFQLMRGTKVTINPVEVIQDVMRVGVPSHVFIEEHNATWQIQGESGIDYQPFHATLKANSFYDILVEPEPDAAGRQRPPFALLSQEPAKLSPDDFALSPGVGVNGRLSVGSADTPVPGARVWLRTEGNPNTSIERLSTADWSDDYGLYGVRASKGGLYSLYIAPATGSRLPAVKVPNAIDLRQALDDSSLTKIDFRWEDIGTTDLTLTVLGLDGNSGAADTTVRLVSADDAWPQAGTLTVGTTSLPASGSARRDGTTDATGTVTFANLPKGDYRVTLRPSDALADTAITTSTLALGSAGASTKASVSLAKQVRLSGHLTLPTKEPAAGTRVVAVDQGNDVMMEAPSTTVDPAGQYELRLAPGRTYSIFAEPPPGQHLPMRVPLMVKQTSQTDMPPLSPLQLPSGIAVSGQVTFLRGKGVPGAVVQAFCYDMSADSHSPACIYAKNVTPQIPLPLAEATTGADGKYVLYLPEPGTGN